MDLQYHTIRSVQTSAEETCRPTAMPMAIGHTLIINSINFSLIKFTRPNEYQSTVDLLSPVAEIICYCGT